MGRSKRRSSCFKIICCARGHSATVDGDDELPAASPEKKVSSDKQRWSFRKKSPGRPAPSSTVITETVSVSYSKENSEVPTINLHRPKTSGFTDKHIAEDAHNAVTPLSSVSNKQELAVSLVPDRNSSTADDSIQEPFAVIVQAFIRGHLARNELYKLKNVIRVQAAVRGHLVRRQAVGTLRCALAIIKMQTLVRARYACTFSKKLDEHDGETFQLDICSPAIVEKRDSCTKLDKRYTSTLHSIRFARQLLEYTPKAKPIYINCDPSKRDSAWKWLQRWMALTIFEGQKEEQNFECCEAQKEKSELSSSEAQIDDTSGVFSVPSDSRIGLCESTMPLEEAHLISKNSGDLWSPEPIDNSEKCFNSVFKDGQGQCLLEDELVVMEEDGELKTYVKTDVSLISHIPAQTDRIVELEHDQYPEKPGSESILEEHDMIASSKPLEAEIEDLVVVSESCDPVPHLGKPEGLISITNSGRASDSSLNTVAASGLDNSSHSHVDPSAKTRDHSLAENSFSNDPLFPATASECGTEILISSTLDSPDRAETEGGEIVLELGSLDKQKDVLHNEPDICFRPDNAEAENPSFNHEALQAEVQDKCNQHMSNSPISNDALQHNQQSAAPTTSGTQLQEGNIADQVVSKPSIMKPAQNKLTATEVHGTPPSQNSGDSRKKRKGNRKPDKKEISQISKNSPSNSTKGSGVRNNTELLQQDVKNVKRRNSLGADGTNYVDDEPRISSSSSLPSYMQATESARAKALLSTFPKSSPDLHNKEIHLKRRHSLPNGNGKQGLSPRMIRSPSQAQQSPKGNLPHHSAERRWQR